MVDKNYALKNFIDLSKLEIQIIQLKFWMVNIIHLDGFLSIATITTITQTI